MIGGSEHLKDEAFEITRFGDRQEDWVIGRLGTALQNSESSAGFPRCIGDDREESRLAHVMRTGAGDENAAGRKQPESPRVEFTVGACGGIDSVAGLGKGRRIEDDGVVGAA